jgi:hypothetical protein
MREKIIAPIGSAVGTLATDNSHGVFEATRFTLKVLAET